MCVRAEARYQLWRPSDGPTWVWDRAEGEPVAAFDREEDAVELLDELNDREDYGCCRP